MVWQCFEQRKQALLNTADEWSKERSPKKREMTLFEDIGVSVRQSVNFADFQ